MINGGSVSGIYTGTSSADKIKNLKGVVVSKLTLTFPSITEVVVIKNIVI